MLMIMCFSCVPNTPDIVAVGEGQREVLILEVGCSFDCYMEQAFAERLLKYQPLYHAWTALDILASWWH
jgi:hypothetical protein